MGIQTNGRTGIQTNGRTGIQTNGWTDIQTNGWTDIQTNGRTDIQTNGRTDRHTVFIQYYTVDQYGERPYVLHSIKLSLKNKECTYCVYTKLKV
mgnify:CR=1 FL=1